MKALTTYLTESSQSKVAYLGFSKAEMIEDYTKMDDYPTTAEKKEMAAKYHIESKKVKEIQTAILLQMRALRFEQKSFDEMDLRYYYRLEVPEKTKLDGESTAFIMYLKDRLYKKIEERKLDKKIAMVKTRDWNYYMTGADRSTILDYLKCVDVLDSRDVKKIEAKNEKEEILNGIILKLVEQCKDFHDKFIEDAKQWAEKMYDRAPKRLEELEERRREISDEKDALAKKLRETMGWRYSSSYEYRTLEEKYNKASRSINELKGILRKTKQEFIKENEEGAENSFNNNINNLAEKIQTKEFDFENLKVNSISDDPKYFELEVTDGKETLYARSIWAAEYSDKVTAHFRFIITNKRK